ncbi:MAG: hypothetical protein IZT58_09380 [Actinobacteria bacterium]|nr:hypothetical protein [Actinomycetota bacterium]
MTSANSGSFVEAAAVAALGGVFGAAVGSPLGLAIPVGAIAAANGAISGWRQVYDWSCSNGLVAFTLDSTWAFPMTAAGLFSHGVALLSKKPGYDASLSRRQNRHVYRRGFMPRRGFAITVGNVISGAGDMSLPRRQRLVTDHEDVHVWQARWFGPFYPLLYGGWMLLGGAVGAVVWVVSRRSDRFTKVVESSAYYVNPFEWWAYSRANQWPPSGKVKGLGWRRPMVQPFRIE